MFEPDPVFALTSAFVGELKLSQVRLNLDARFPWLLLLPRVGGARELEDLSPSQRRRLMDEVMAASAAVRRLGGTLGRPVEKLNVGLLGNMTPQLHIHVVGRRRDDAAWPGPVWGAGRPEPYAGGTRDAAVAVARQALGI